MHRARVLLAVVSVAALIAGAYLAGQSLHNSGLNSLQSAVYGQCHRQNVGRITGNRNAYAQYRLWDAALTLFQYGEGIPPANGAPTDQRAALLLRALLAAMTTQLRTESWTPMSNCRQATDQPLSYTPPPAVPFVKQLPPLSAFTLGPNE